jgi:regulatory Fis family protein
MVKATQLRRSGRPRKVAPHDLSGQIKSSRTESPTLMHRALAALRRKLEDPTYASPAGLLEFCEDITKAERTAGERFARDCLTIRRLAAEASAGPIKPGARGETEGPNLDLLDPVQRAAVMAHETLVTSRYHTACQVLLRLPDGKRIKRNIENIFISETELEPHEISLLSEGLKALVRHYDCARRVQDNALEAVADRTRKGVSRRNALSIPVLSTSGHIRPLEEVEADMIRLAFGRYRGRMTEMAKHLGMGRTTLYRRMREIGLKRGS